MCFDNICFPFLIAKMLATLICQLPRLNFSRFSSADVLVRWTKFHITRRRETPFQWLQRSRLVNIKCVGTADGIEIV